MHSLIAAIGRQLPVGASLGGRVRVATDMTILTDYGDSGAAVWGGAVWGADEAGAWRQVDTADGRGELTVWRDGLEVVRRIIDADTSSTA